MRKPIRPRDGTRNSIRTQPVPWLVICSMRPLRVGQDLGDRAEELLGGVDGEALDRLVGLAVDLAGDHLRLADGQLVALAAHLLDEDGQRELTAALHLPGVGALGGEHAQRDVADELLVEAVLDHAGGDLGAADPADHRAGVGADGHRDGRLVDGDDRQRDGVLGVGEGLADHDLGDARDGDDVAGAGRLGGLALQRLGHQQLGDLDPLDGAVDLAPGDELALADGAVVHAQQGEAAEEVGGVEVGDVGLQRRLVVVDRRGDGRQDRLEERLEVLGVRAGRRSRGGSSTRGRSWPRRRRWGTRSGARRRRGP